MDLKGRSFLSTLDFTPTELHELLDLAASLKSQAKAGSLPHALKGKTIVLLFEKASFRTRISFELMAQKLGAHVTYLDADSSQMGKKESLADTARVLGRFFDGIEYRGASHQVLLDLAQYSGVPVWSGLSEIDHPTQSLACFLALREALRKPFSQMKFVNVGHGGGNMATAMLFLSAKLGVHYVSYSPPELPIPPRVLELSRAAAEESGAIIEYSDDPAVLSGADALYTDVWFSMAELDQAPERVRLLSPFRVTPALLEKTNNPDCLFMHSQPSFHDFNTEVAQKLRAEGYDIREVLDEIYSSSRCKTMEETENGLFTKAAVMIATLGN